MASKLDGNSKEVTDVTVQRQCEWEYLDPIAGQVADADVILSLGCGVGVQALAEHFPLKPDDTNELPNAVIDRTRPPDPS